METHDFPKKELGKAVPYGVYDIAQNEAGVTVGISSDTAEFAVAAIDRWWTKLGKVRYSKGKRVLITADSGGSNSPRTRLWRVELQKLQQNGTDHRGVPLSPGRASGTRSNTNCFAISLAIGGESPWKHSKLSLI
ncbi:MAG: hypothetical protein KF851_04655 [Pirellulaceae bacterium]|nr:hypothetical protein [Pirellulaceae bacterium]